MLLLIQKGEYGVYKIEYNLQYTLLLLIRNAEIKEWFEYGFTIHFATINTAEDKTSRRMTTRFTLHFATINTVIHFTQYL